MTRPSRYTIIHASFLAFAFAIVVRAGYVQVWQKDEWSVLANQQHTTAQKIPAPRGTIFDAEGTVLVESRPLVTLQVAPNEVRRTDVTRLKQALKKLDVPPNIISRVGDTTRKWVEIPGRYLSADAKPATSVTGVKFQPAMDRVASPLVGLGGLIGHADADGAGIDGIELALDSLLRGKAGRAALVRDGRGKKDLSPEAKSYDPVPGHSVTLTLRLDLQDIAEHALGDAVRSTHSKGGDVVVLDPRSGELLALASRRADPRATTATALTEPVEPGSTLKPFVAAALLEKKRVTLDEVFQTYNGDWTYRGFKLNDAHKAASLTFRQVIEYSSNIGMAQASERLTAQEEYETLRDFGFGTPTGLPFPSEASGRLREPKYWTVVSQASLSRGYEMMATPVQLAVAYAAIANGGELLQPAIIKEIRDSKGATVYHHQREVVRRVMSKELAKEMREVLRLVVDSGTATKADLATYDVGGKSGTAKRTENGKYVAGAYTATFVGLFPAKDPQLVVFVKLDSPDAAAYYGGIIAAPVMKAVIEAALASRDGAFDWSSLKQHERPMPVAAVPVAAPVAEPAPVDAEPDGSVPFVLSLANGSVKRTEPVAVAGDRPVPDVHGLSMRGAANTLHRAGVRVKMIRGGERGETLPAAGATVKAGSVVRLYSGA